MREDVFFNSNNLERTVNCFVGTGVPAIHYYAKALAKLFGPTH